MLKTMKKQRLFCSPHASLYSIAKNLIQLRFDVRALAQQKLRNDEKLAQATAHNPHGDLLILMAY